MFSLPAGAAQARQPSSAVRVPARAPMPSRSVVTPAARLDRVARDDGLSRTLSAAVTRRSQGTLLQRYIEYTDSDGDDMRVSDDGTVQAGSNYPNHLLWAKEGLVEKANEKLEAVGSGVELIEYADDQYATEIPCDDGSTIKLKRVGAYNKNNDTEGDEMLLYADCGRSASVIVGSGDRRAMYALRAETRAIDHIDDNNPTLMKIGIMRNWLRDQIATAAKELDVSKRRDTSKLQAALDAGDSADVTLAAVTAEKKAWTKDTPKSTRDAWSVKYRRQLKKVAEAYFTYYNGLSVSERDTVAAALEIDEYARPDVGQGFTTSSGGANIKGKSTWNFHWAGVVLTSEDKADIVVLENYSVSKYDEENTNWTFDMYGTKKRAQTFHGRHKGTGQHGETPTTMIIEKRA